MVDYLADAINTIRTNEHIGRRECTIRSTKLIRAVMDVMKGGSYIGGYEEFDDRHVRMMKVSLSNRINKVGVIKPRSAVTKNNIRDYESRYIPSRDFGMLIISTPAGLMTNKEAKEKGTGGRLIAYVY
ncbi:MAG: 30S ribosomal protein S8 [Candidatus Marsarchaeota archaeon]|jgi:small subunit ribosomal protein S8|nr:30S ribosomal protein S8 [Candidatus Marsarchaeota archaeon]